MNETLSALIGLVGWVGAAVTIGAYASVTNGRVSPNSVAYQGLNIGGAAALALSATVSGAWPSAATNLIWVAIGVHAVLSLKRVGIRRRAIRAVSAILVLLQDRRGEVDSVVVPALVGPLPLPIR